MATWSERKPDVGDKVKWYDDEGGWRYGVVVPQPASWTRSTCATHTNIRRMGRTHKVKNEKIRTMEGA